MSSGGWSWSCGGSACGCWTCWRRQTFLLCSAGALGADHHGLDDVRVIGEGQLLGVLGVDHFLLALAGAYALSTLSLSVGVHGAMYVLL